MRVADNPLRASGCRDRLLNKTRTLAGARLLKANILQPLTDIDTIRRQTCCSLHDHHVV